MADVAGIAGVLVILIVLWDAFETMVLPRRVTRRVRLTRIIVLFGWKFWRIVARRTRHRPRREALLSYFGPLAVIALFGTWALGLIVGFALLQTAFGSRLAAPEGAARFGTDLYMSGTTFFTLGLGDVVPRSGPARFITVLESGLGLGFLALVISYLPVLYQGFSRRETRVSLLDAWAGSPPTAGELLRRLGPDGRDTLLAPFLQEWELWSAQLLESMISYPILGYFRSQHDNQSWLSALTAVLDACAVLISSVEDAPVRSASLTFAMARHAVVDLCQILGAPPRFPSRDRLPPADRARLWTQLRAAGLAMRDDAASAARMQELREMYEPYVHGLARRLLLPLPPWLPADGVRDNWQRTAWRSIGTEHDEPDDR